jgi:hypothetical protein
MEGCRVTRLLAVDPGPHESAYVVVEDDLRPDVFRKEPNAELVQRLRLYNPFNADRAVIEWISNYGSTPGADVFETCLWTGRFAEAIYLNGGYEAELVKRHLVKMHLCGTANAKDSNVIQALVERFAPGWGNYGKGGKDNPGPFHGFRKDLWQSYALAVYAVDTAGVTVQPMDAGERFT